MKIRTWQQFGRRVRAQNTNLLARLPDQDSPILVAGCQRSGGTMLAAAFTEHSDIIDFSWSKDAELDAAQVLAGVRAPETAAPSPKRYCFQTTYLNERYVEYQDHVENYYLIWLLRNPFSVVYSMLYNWKRFALNEVFLGCGAALLPYSLQRKLGKYGVLGVPPLERACYAWLGKLEQAKVLLQQLPPDRFRLIEYEALVTNKAELMGSLCKFSQLEGPDTAGAEISTRSLTKADSFSAAEHKTVEILCSAPYEEFRRTLEAV